MSKSFSMRTPVSFARCVQAKAVLCSFSSSTDLLVGTHHLLPSFMPQFYRTSSQSWPQTLHSTLAGDMLSPPAETCCACRCAGLISQSQRRPQGRTLLGICLPTPCPLALEALFTGGTFLRKLSGRKKMHKVSSLVTCMLYLYAQQR